MPNLPFPLTTTISHDRQRSYFPPFLNPSHVSRFLIEVRLWTLSDIFMFRNLATPPWHVYVDGIRLFSFSSFGFLPFFLSCRE